MEPLQVSNARVSGEVRRRLSLVKAQWISLCSRLGFSVVLLDEGSLQTSLESKLEGTWWSQLEVGGQKRGHRLLRR